MVFMPPRHEPFRGGMAAVSGGPTKFFAGSVIGTHRLMAPKKDPRSWCWNPRDPPPRNSHALVLFII